MSFRIASALIPRTVFIVLLTANSMVAQDRFLSSDPTDSKTYWTDLINGRRELTDSMIEASAQNILHWVSDKPAGSIALLERSEADVLVGILRGRPSPLFPEVISGLEPQMTQHPIRSFALGGAYYSQQDYRQAIRHYNDALELASDGSQLFYLTSMNLSACYNESDQLDSAIQVLEHALEATPSGNPNEAVPEWIQTYYERIRINLGALQVTSYDYLNALNTLAETDTSRLDAYWNNLLWCNVMLANQGLAKFEQRDSVWFNRVQYIPFEELDPAFHAHALHQILIEKDFIQFQKFKKALSRWGSSSLTEESSPYSALWDTALSDRMTLAAFQLYAKWAENEDQFQLQRVQKVLELNRDRLTELEAHLNAATEKNHFIVYATGGLFLLISAGFLGYFYHFRTKRRERAEAVDLVLNPTQPQAKTPPLPIDRSDIRIIGDAISHGRKISDALLVLKKLTSLLDVETQPLHPLRSLDRIPEVEKLSEREFQVLQHIASGFDAKEISRSLDMAPEYIYNLRSRIRKKLQIPKEQPFEVWVERVQNSDI